MLKHVRLALPFSAGLFFCAGLFLCKPGAAQTMQVKDANGTTITVPTLPGIGQKTTAGSLPVTLPSDMPALAVTPSLPAGASTAANQTTMIGALSTLAGNIAALATATAQTTANGYLAAIASNTANASQGTANGSLATIATNTAGLATSTGQTTANGSLATIVTNTTGLATASGQNTANTSLGSIASAQTTANTSLGTIATNTAGLATASAQTAGNAALSTIASNTAKLAAIAPIASTAAEASHVLKASAGTLYGYAVTSGSSAGYVMIFDAATVPADGAVAPKHCEYLPANTVLGGSANGDPAEAYANGIVVVFSSTGCFTKTGQTAMFIRGRVQ